MSSSLTSRQWPSITSLPHSLAQRFMVNSMLSATICPISAERTHPAAVAVRGATLATILCTVVNACAEPEPTSRRQYPQSRALVLVVENHSSMPVPARQVKPSTQIPDSPGFRGLANRSRIRCHGVME